MQKKMLYGDGIHDDAPAIQDKLDSGISCVDLPVPAKNYSIGTTLHLHSGQTLRLAPTTVIRLLPGSSCKMLDNDPNEKESHDIGLIGGIWDMDNMNQAPNPLHQEWASEYKYPFKPYIGTDHGRYKPDGYLGAAIELQHITRLLIRDVSVRNPVTYAFHCCCLNHFTVENIRFIYDADIPHHINMDGFHLDGGSRFGVIRNLQGTTHDDLLALNADDCITGTLENIEVDGIFAENCKSAVRLLSRGSLVDKISISNVYATSYGFGIGFTRDCSDTSQRGKFGRISFRNIFLSCGVPVPDYWGQSGIPIFIFSGCIDIDFLSIENYHRFESYKPLPTFNIDKDTHIGTLALSNLSMQNTTGGHIQFIKNEGTIDRLTAQNVLIRETTPVSGNGTIGSFLSDEVSRNLLP